ncbi:cellulose biosynthesis protein BcsR [Aeromonas eucrenophila]|uniref:Cellulose biosynthesis protein BcsR n=1 Tax=Aeromonas eucrenophila TaxID=649 RepID=A0ABW0Y7W4_9GAMM|nr:cellulose biosynthesis protein BcsR [Aeromonas eucrenophila]
MKTDKQQMPLTPFGVPVEGEVVSDVAMVQQTFDVQLPYQDIALNEHLAALRARFPLLAELDMNRSRG